MSGSQDLTPCRVLALLRLPQPPPPLQPVVAPPPTRPAAERPENWWC